VRRHVSGRDHFLSFDPEPLRRATDWMMKSRHFWSSRLDALEAALRAEDAIAAAKKPFPKPKHRRKS
jgi:hypothetical protein